MTINAWKTSFIGLSKPPKVLAATVSSSENMELWPYQLGQDDPYWSGGINPLPYRYRMTFSFSDQGHGSHLTRTPFLYNAQDIEVGDFVAGADDGKVLQIMSIESKSEYSLVAIVEDRLRYNVYKTGSSIFNVPGNVIFFQINELGLPMLDPLPGTASPTFYPNVMSRFQYMNPLTNYVLVKTAHGFEKGDAVCIEDGEFVLSDADNITKFVGTVIEPGPGPDQFILRPANGIIDFVPGLPGNVGDYIYPSLDGSGDLTTNDASQRPVFMKVAAAIPTFTIGSNLDPVGNDSDVVEINKVQITLSSGNGSYNLDDAIAAINSETTAHKLTADKVNGVTSATSNIANLGSAYGVIAGYVPFSAEINGIVVNFTTTTSGSVSFGDTAVSDANDMAFDINQAAIPNITAAVLGTGELIITNAVGGAITVVNLTNDINNNPWAGANSLSSIELSTPANTTNFVLRLTRADGGPMTIRDVQGQFFNDAGVISGQNGRYALGLYIEQGLRSSKTTMVANIAARDALYPLPGDQAHVIDAGNGEWAIYLFDGATWSKIANQRSESTDARTLILDIDLDNYPNGGTETIGYISADRTIISTRVLVTSAATTALVTVGTSVNSLELMETRDSVLSKTGQYSVESNYRTTGYTEIIANISNPDQDSGQFTIILTYV
jgi:hypothetical protein